MAIFQNEAIRSLPEQVEKNKEDIKEINDILENIDPDQVATILSDIASIKAEQVVQNTAIGSNTTAINNEKTAREDVVGVNVVGNTYLKTATPNKQILINNNGLVSISSSNNNVDITAPSGFARLSTDNASVKADDVNGVSLSTNQSDAPNLVILRPNGEFEVSNDHTLKFDTTGALTIDGQPIGGGGGGSQLYRHCITLSKSNPSSEFQMSFDIINSSSEPIDTNAKIAAYLYNNSLTSNTNCLGINGFYYDGTNMYWAVGIFASNNSVTQVRAFNIAHNYYDLQISTVTVYDKVITL